MKRSSKTFSRMSAAVAVAASLGVANTAAAQGGVQVDNSGAWQTFGRCTLGVACSGTTLGFQIDVGHGLTDKVYVYSNGVTSIGHELTIPSVAYNGDGTLNTAWQYSLDDFAGQDYFSPVFGPHAGAVIVTNNAGPNLDIVWAYPLPPAFNSVSCCEYVEFQLTPIAGNNPGAFQLKFNYGGAHFQNPTFDSDWGYSFGDQEGGSLANGLPQGANSASWRFDLGSTQLSASDSVPEPAVWVLMIAGLGVAGASLRHRARRLPMRITSRLGMNSRLN